MSSDDTVICGFDCKMESLIPCCASGVVLEMEGHRPGRIYTSVGRTTIL